MLRYALAALSTLALSAPALAQDNYGACAGDFSKLLTEGAKISKIQGMVVDRDRRMITYMLPEGMAKASYKPGDAELQAVQKEVQTVSKSWYVVITTGSKWQPHYARDEGDGCVNYPVAPAGVSG